MLVRFILVALAALSVEADHLKIATAQLPPAMYIERGEDGNMTFHGSGKDTIDELAHRLNFTYNFVAVDGKEGDTKTAITMLAMKKVDMACVYIQEMTDLKSVIDYTVAFAFDSLFLIAPYPEEKSRLLAPISPFQPMVWLFYILTFIAVAIVLAAISVKYSKSRKRDVHELQKSKTSKEWLLDSLMYLLLVALGQGGFISFNRLGIRLVAGAWCLGSIVLLYGYSSNLISFMTVPRMQSVPKGLDDLALNYPHISFTLEKNRLLAQFFLDSTDGPMKILGDSLREDPKNLYAKYEDLLDLLSKGHHATVVSLPQAKAAINDVFEKTGRCTLTIIDLGVMKPLSMGLVKGMPYKQAIDKQLRYYVDFGLLDFWTNKKYQQKGQQCLTIVEPKTKLKPIKLTDTKGAFLVLGIGLGLSTIVFIVERIVVMKKTRPKKVTTEENVDTGNKVSN